MANEPSPWSGLSGAAAFSGDLLIGVVVIDTPRFRSGRLTAVPAWRLLEQPGFAAVLESHGCSLRCESVELLGLFERGHARSLKHIGLQSAPMYSEIRVRSSRSAIAKAMPAPRTG